MRRIAAMLVLLLTASAAWADLNEVNGAVHTALFGAACCGTIPLVLIFTLAITLAIHDNRKAARRRELMNRSTGDE